MKHCSKKLPPNSGDTFDYLLDLDPTYGPWQTYAALWLERQITPLAKQTAKSALHKFFTIYHSKLGIGKNPQALFTTKASLPSLFSALMLDHKDDKYSMQCNDIIHDFVQWVCEEEKKTLRPTAAQAEDTVLRNPFTRFRKKTGSPQERDDDFRYLLKYDATFEVWREYGVVWLKSRCTPQGRKEAKRALHAFFVFYIHNRLGDYNPLAVLQVSRVVPPLSEVLGSVLATDKKLKDYNDIIYAFVEWVLIKESAKLPFSTASLASQILRNPFTRMRQKRRLEGCVDSGSTTKMVAIPYTDDAFSFLREMGHDYDVWRNYAVSWLAVNNANPHEKRLALAHFFVRYVHEHLPDKRPQSLLDGRRTVPSLRDILAINGALTKTARIYNDHIHEFMGWVVHCESEKLRDANRSEEAHHLRNPFPRIRRKLGKLLKAVGHDFSKVGNDTPEWQEWRSFGIEWLNGSDKDTETKRTALSFFFLYYLSERKLNISPMVFLDVDFSAPSYEDTLNEYPMHSEAWHRNHDYVVDFLDWIMGAYQTKVPKGGTPTVPLNIRNPFARKKIKRHGVREDTELKYLTQCDPRMEDWRVLAAEWVNSPDQERDYATKLNAFKIFFCDYVINCKLTSNPYTFLRKDYVKPPFRSSMDTKGLNFGKQKKRSANSETPPHLTRYNNHIHNFLQWILEDKLSIATHDNETVIPYEYHNPVRFEGHGRTFLAETPKVPLPYGYIIDLRRILSDGANATTSTFNDWMWARNIKGDEKDWFVVERSMIDESDPDCVWRQRPANESEKKRGLSVVYELWSPVRAVALLVKLHLPLRTFQVRVLDSGEGDTLRYESGNWVLNSSHLATGDEKHPTQRGVFYREPTAMGGNSQTKEGAGLYINTNKTADIDKNESAKGYIIPWNHEVVLYWLERLRNWQSKYNPLQAPTAWSTLGAKQLDRLYSKPVLEARGTCCFLFRNAAGDGDDRWKPVSSYGVDCLWHNLLSSFEVLCAERGETLPGGKALVFVSHENNRTTYFPLHNLRVALITAYIIDGHVPLPILSKLIAGHSRIIMTLHYTKLGKAHVTHIMQEAERRILEKKTSSLGNFLMEKAYKDIDKVFVFNSPDAVVMAQEQQSAAAFIFTEKGICPVGGALCACGGELLLGETQRRAFAPVVGYPREKNCCRCRFFLTGPAFLFGLSARFNEVSLRLKARAERFLKAEKHVRVLKDVRDACSLNKELFTQYDELKRASHYYEQEAEAVDNLWQDLSAVTRLIDRSRDIANAKDAKGLPIVPTGRIADIGYTLYETESELYQLETVCRDAVIYPEIDATVPIIRRTQLLDRILDNNGFPQILCKYSVEEQLVYGNHLMKMIQACTSCNTLAEAVDFAECKRKFAEIGLGDKQVAAALGLPPDSYTVGEIKKTSLLPAKGGSNGPKE